MSSAAPPSDLGAALARIAQLEEELRQSKQELVQEKRNNESDVSSALRMLQDQWNSKYELLSTSVPDVDRLVPPKKRQLICTTIVFLLPPFCVFITCALIFCSAYNYTVACFMLTYFAFIRFDNAACKGSRAKKWFKKHWFWQQISNYFPIVLRKANPKTQFPASATYLFGYHPHGIISVGGFIGFGTDATGFSDMFPGKHHFTNLFHSYRALQCLSSLKCFSI
jgi:hypothetical protein